MKKSFKFLMSLVLSSSLVMPSSFSAMAATITTNTVPVPKVATADAGKRVIAYFPNWGNYEASQQNITVSNIPWDKVTTIQHAFFEITKDFKIQSTDKEMDFQTQFAHSTTALAGHFGEYKYYKNLYPNVKLAVSVGGWTRSEMFHEAAINDTNRKALANSMVDLMKKYPFVDGIDIDWEYPTETRAPEDSVDRGSVGGPEDKHNFTLLLKQIRETFNANGMTDKALSVAVGAGKSKIQETEPDQYAQYVDYIGIMSYDFAGDWDSVTGNLAGLYHNPKDTTRPGFDLDSAIKLFANTYKVPKDKLVAGSPLYSRGWGNVAPGPNKDGLFQAGDSSFKGNLGNGGQFSWFDVKKMETQPGWQKFRDPIARTPYLYNAGTKQFITYEDEQSLQERVDYVNTNGYGGVMFWDASGDDFQSGYPMLTKAYNGLVKNVAPSLKTASLSASAVNNGSYTLSAVVPSYNTATSYKILEGSTVISTGDVKVNQTTAQTINFNVTGKSQGTYNYTVVLNDVTNTVTSNAVSVVVPEAVVNTLQPATLSVSVVNNGAYTLSAVVPGNNTATSYTILEGTTVVSSGTILANQTATQAINYNVTGKAQGAYSYSIVLNDGTKTISSNVVNVTVPAPVVGTLQAATVKVGTITNGSYTLTATVPSKNSAVSYQILEGTTVVSTGTVLANQAAAQTITYNVTGKTQGTYKYTVVLSDGTKTINSKVISVVVPATVVNKLQAATLSLGTVNGGNYTLTGSVPKNNTATSYKILEGTTIIATGTVKANQTAEQTITFNVTGKVAGTYSYTIVLSDATGTVTSNVITVTVSGSTTNYSAWSAGTSYKTGDIVSYLGKNYKCVQGHTALLGWEPSVVLALWSPV